MTGEFTVRILRVEAMTADRLDALEGLIRLCRQDGVDGEIAYRPPTTGTPSPWWENTLISIGDAMPSGAAADVQRLADVLARRASEWAEARLERAETGRPQSITIFDPAGLPVRKIEVAGDAVPEGH
jgi:hypothetical protein